MAASRAPSVDKPQLRMATARDAAALCEIYNPYVLQTTITFEELALTERDMAQRIDEVRAAGLPWLLLEGAQVLGYAYATPWRSRSAYRYAVEVSVYLRAGSDGQGLGSALYTALFEQLQQAGKHILIAGIALPNAASVALHEKFGMRQVAHFERVGFKAGQWLDVGYWQCHLPQMPTLQA